MIGLVYTDLVFQADLGTILNEKASNVLSHRTTIEVLVNYTLPIQESGDKFNCHSRTGVNPKMKDVVYFFQQEMFREVDLMLKSLQFVVELDDTSRAFEHVFFIATEVDCEPSDPYSCGLDGCCSYPKRARYCAHDPMDVTIIGNKPDDTKTMCFRQKISFPEAVFKGNLLDGSTLQTSKEEFFKYKKFAVDEDLNTVLFFPRSLDSEVELVIIFKEVTKVGVLLQVIITDQNLKNITENSLISVEGMQSDGTNHQCNLREYSIPLFMDYIVLPFDCHWAQVEKLSIKIKPIKNFGIVELIASKYKLQHQKILELFDKTEPLQASSRFEDVFEADSKTLNELLSVVDKIETNISSIIESKPPQVTTSPSVTKSPEPFTYKINALPLAPPGIYGPNVLPEITYTAEASGDDILSDDEDYDSISSSSSTSSSASAQKNSSSAIDLSSSSALSSSSVSQSVDYFMLRETVQDARRALGRAETALKMLQSAKRAKRGIWNRRKRQQVLARWRNEISKSARQRRGVKDWLSYWSLGGHISNSYNRRRFDSVEHLVDKEVSDLKDHLADTDAKVLWLVDHDRAVQRLLLSSICKMQEAAEIQYHLYELKLRTLDLKYGIVTDIQLCFDNKIPLSVDRETILKLCKAVAPNGNCVDFHGFKSLIACQVVSLDLYHKRIYPEIHFQFQLQIPMYSEEYRRFEVKTVPIYSKSPETQELYGKLTQAKETLASAVKQATTTTAATTTSQPFSVDYAVAVSLAADIVADSIKQRINKAFSREKRSMFSNPDSIRNETILVQLKLPQTIYEKETIIFQTSSKDINIEENQLEVVENVKFVGGKILITTEFDDFSFIRLKEDQKCLITELPLLGLVAITTTRKLNIIDTTGKQIRQCRNICLLARNEVTNSCDRDELISNKNTEHTVVIQKQVVSAQKQAIAETLQKELQTKLQETEELIESVNQTSMWRSFTSTKLKQVVTENWWLFTLTSFSVTLVTIAVCVCKLRSRFRREMFTGLVSKFRNNNNNTKIIQHENRNLK